MPQRLLDLVDPVGIGDRRAVVLEHVVDVETEAVLGGRDARIDDRQAELVEHRGGARKAVAAMRREDQHRRRAALAVRLDRDQRIVRGGVAERSRRV